MKLPRITAAVVAALALPVLASCTDNSASSSSGDDRRTISVTSSDDTCKLSADDAPAGNLVFQVTNEGDQVTEFYLYAEDGLRIVGEVENVGPGLSRDLVINVPAGSYIPACKPGMSGQGIRSDLTVTEASGSDGGPDAGAGGGATGGAGGGATGGATQEQVDAATEQYHAYVTDQTEQLLLGTKEFVAAYTAGDDDKARTLYPVVRVHWERIEPVAESFGDLDPTMDLREADLEPGQEWTGWHRIEKDLWPPASGYQALAPRQRATYADRLLRDTVTLDERADGLELSVDQIGNGAKSLLDEVATGKVTGEEEIWSHTDLYDFQANVDGARVAFEGLRPVLSERDPALEKQLDHRFAVLQGLLDQHHEGTAGFVPYTELERSQVRELSDAVNALSEPLSTLTAAVTL